MMIFNGVWGGLVQNNKERLEMTSNVFNPLSEKSPEEIVLLLQNIAGQKLSNPQTENATFIISKLGTDPNIANIVKACENAPGLREFAIRVGVTCLPGSAYKAIFDREFSSAGRARLWSPLSFNDSHRHLND